MISLSVRLCHKIYSSSHQSDSDFRASALVQHTLILIMQYNMRWWWWWSEEEDDGKVVAVANLGSWWKWKQSSRQYYILYGHKKELKTTIHNPQWQWDWKYTALLACMLHAFLIPWSAQCAALLLFWSPGLLSVQHMPSFYQVVCNKCLRSMLVRNNQP